jgi:mxaC protein
MNFDHPIVFWLLPLALLPFWVTTGRVQAHPWLALVKHDRLSTLLDMSLRLLAAAVIALLIHGLAGPFIADVPVLRVTKGAETVVLFDKSRSMDQPFAAKDDKRHRLDSRRQTKGQVARDALAEFVANRTEDRFALVLFSTFAVPVLDFTRNQTILQSAIAATQTERGLSDTDMARALESALDYFENQPYIGNRIVLLVSDGGARLSSDERESIKARVERNKVSLYWIYLRSFRSPGLLPDENMGEEAIDSVPEHFLHRYFTELGTPYRAFEADEPDAMKRAIEEIGRLENSPLRYMERKARVPLADRSFMWALVGLIFLAALRFATRGNRYLSWTFRQARNLSSVCMRLATRVRVRLKGKAHAVDQI